jgi:hypothetical protein
MADDLDPFGRRKDENPLASLGWHGDETASTVESQPERAASPEPAEEGWRAPPSQPQPQPPTKPRPPRERTTATTTTTTAETASPQREAERLESIVRARLGRGQGAGVARMVRALVVIVIVFAVLGGIISTLVGEGVDRADEFLRDLETPDVQVPAVPGSGERSPSGREQATLPARGLSINSLLRPAAFGRAIRRLRTGGYGRLSHLRVAPDRIDATMLTKDGRLRMLQIVPGGRVNVLQTSPGGFTGAPTMALKGIDAGAPSRLTRSAAGRLEQPASRVDYLVLSDFAGTRGWNVYFKGGQIFSADARGRITRRNN